MKNWPRKAVIYYNACRYFLKHYPERTASHAARTDRGTPCNRGRKQQMFRFVLQHMLNQARTEEWQLRYHVSVKHHARRPESKMERSEYNLWQQQTYFGDAPHTTTTYKPWDFLSLPEGVLLRDLRRLGGWLPPSSRRKRQSKERGAWSVTESCTPAQLFMSTTDICRLPMKQPRFYHTVRHIAHHPVTFRDRYSERTSKLLTASHRKMMRFIRSFGNDFWDEHTEPFRNKQSILRPQVLPSPRLTRLGMTLAFGKRFPRPCSENVIFYHGNDTSLAGTGWLRRNEVQGGRVIKPDPRLACQVALYSAPRRRGRM